MFRQWDEQCKQYRNQHLSTFLTVDLLGPYLRMKPNSYSVKTFDHYLASATKNSLELEIGRSTISEVRKFFGGEGHG